MKNWRVRDCSAEAVVEALRTDENKRRRVGWCWQEFGKAVFTNLLAVAGQESEPSGTVWWCGEVGDDGSKAWTLCWQPFG